MPFCPSSAVTVEAVDQVARHVRFETGSANDQPDLGDLAGQIYRCETSLPGVFAIGDVRSGSVKRVASGLRMLASVRTNPLSSSVTPDRDNHSVFGSAPANGQLLPQSFRRMTLCVFARSARGRPCDIGAGRKATYSVRTSGANVPLCRPKLSGGVIRRKMTQYGSTAAPSSSRERPESARLARCGAFRRLSPF
jgi:hypothetical protein